LDSLSNARCSLNWVKGHSGDAGNDAADKIAVWCRTHERSFHQKGVSGEPLDFSNPSLPKDSRPVSGAASDVQGYLEAVSRESIKIAYRLHHAQKDADPDFMCRFFRECVNGSAIDKDLFAAAVKFIPDNGYWEPNRALNQKVSTFYQTRKPHSYGAIAMFAQENGDYWQGKPQNPRTRQDGSFVKYEAPVAIGACAYRAPVPPSIRLRISQRLGVDVPSDGFFWQWVEAHPEIPVIPTEGAKKALALLSQGYVAVGLFGVNSGVLKNDKVGGEKIRRLNPELVPGLKELATPKRQFTIAFDEDIKPKTRQRVQSATSDLAFWLSKEKCEVAIASWDKEQGKGVDDLIGKSGLEAWESAYQKACSYDDWKILNRLRRQFSRKPDVLVHAPDLSNTDIGETPESGIIALLSAKGTGKTKFIRSLIDERVSALAIGHRVALMRNICDRLGLDYRSDAKNVNKQGYHSNGIYRLGIGTCVDGLLSINPEAWQGKDIIIDEVVQVKRHLLTSSTCQQDGKRPALLSRFRSLVSGARRVIIADADLDNDTIEFIEALRGNEEKSFVIRNNYTPEGFEVVFIESDSSDAIREAIFNDIAALPDGKVVYVATDSKTFAKRLENAIAELFPGKRTLTIHGDNSSESAQREFITSPDLVLSRHEYDVIIATPSVGTGVSIESQGIFEVVHGVFSGHSSNDADITQSLVRVRENVSRVVWTPKRGHNFCKFSNSIKPSEIKRQLKRRTEATIALTRSSLREDYVEALSNFDWDDDIYMDAYARIQAEHNKAMWDLANIVRVRLGFEGNRVTRRCIDEFLDEFNADYQKAYKDSREKIRDVKVEATLNAADLTFEEVQHLNTMESISAEDIAAIAKFWLKEFYCVEEVTKELILWDQEGQKRAQIASLEHLLYPETAIDRTVSSIESQFKWNAGNCPWDISGAELRRKAREIIGINELIDPDKVWTGQDLEPIAQKIRQMAADIKHLLNFTVSDEITDTQLVHQLLSQLGLKTAFSWKGTSGKGKKRVYQLEQETYEKIQAILERRYERRIQQQKKKDHPPIGVGVKQGGDPKNSTPQSPPPRHEKAGWQVGDRVRKGTSLGEWRIDSILGNTAVIYQMQGWASKTPFTVPLEELRTA
ncbi:MAG: plasmid replication protein, CyRepA1 family, partial [Cyanobacteria bacterium J06633_2]